MRSFRRQHAFLLPAVLAITMIMLVAVAALRHYEVLGMRAYTRAEADLQFLLARRWQLFKEATDGKGHVPHDLPVKLESTVTNGTQHPADLAAGP